MRIEKEQGRLLLRMQELRAEGRSDPNARTAVLVIDEDVQNASVPTAVNAAQKTVLNIARTYRWPVLFVQYWREAPRGASQRPEPDPTDPPEAWNCVRSELRSDGAPLFTKLCTTAFGPPVILGIPGAIADWVDFADWLRRNVQARYLIVLGNHVNLCVRDTVVGALSIMGWYEGGKPVQIPGAIGRGYTVISCDRLVWPEVANWKNEPGVDFYDQL